MGPPLAPLEPFGLRWQVFTPRSRERGRNVLKARFPLLFWGLRAATSPAAAQAPSTERHRATRGGSLPDLWDLFWDLAVPGCATGPGGAPSRPALAAASPPQGEAQPARVRAPGACLHMKVAVRSAGLYHLLYDLIWRVPQPPFPTLCMLGCQGPGLSLSALPGLSRQAVIP